jgi:hypothetical protein
MCIVIDEYIESIITTILKSLPSAYADFIAPKSLTHKDGYQFFFTYEDDSRIIITAYDTAGYLSNTKLNINDPRLIDNIIHYIIFMDY